MIKKYFTCLGLTFFLLLSPYLTRSQQIIKTVRSGNVNSCSTYNTSDLSDNSSRMPDYNDIISVQDGHTLNVNTNYNVGQVDFNTTGKMTYAGTSALNFSATSGNGTSCTFAITSTSLSDTYYQEDEHSGTFTLKVNYENGNGKSYYASTISFDGISCTRAAGNLEYGSGQISYSCSGVVDIFSGNTAIVLRSKSFSLRITVGGVTPIINLNYTIQQRKTCVKLVNILYGGCWEASAYDIIEIREFTVRYSMRSKSTATWKNFRSSTVGGGDIIGYGFKDHALNNSTLWSPVVISASGSGYNDFNATEKCYPLNTLTNSEALYITYTMKEDDRTNDDELGMPMLTRANTKIDLLLHEVGYFNVIRIEITSLDFFTSTTRSLRFLAQGRNYGDEDWGCASCGIEVDVIRRDKSIFD